jgi:hypothetical protein
MNEQAAETSNFRAEMTIAGCGLGPPATTHIELGRWGDAYRITCKNEFDGQETETFCAVSVQEVDRQFNLLRKATVCAYAVSPLVCDGEYVKVTIHGEHADLTLGWWTVAPLGADEVFDFSDWMRRLIDPDVEDDESEAE